MNYNSVAMEVYPKNSFDRFGDDLTELIVSYLWFEDKVRLECVSKQWRRLVFNKQTELDIDKEETKHSLRRLIRSIGTFETSIDRQSLESVLKKCPNITKVKLLWLNDSSVLSLIGQYCSRINSLTIEIFELFESLDDTTIEFFRMNGHKLEELILFDDDFNEDNFKNIEKGEKFLKFCPNITKLQVNPNILDQGIEFLSNLNYIKTQLFWENWKIIQILLDKYSKTLKTLCLWILGMTVKDLKQCIEFISGFENLQSLKLEFIADYIPESVEDCLSLIGQKCNKLLKLDLDFEDYCGITDRFFDTFSEFKYIEVLKINLSTNTSVKGSIESLKKCKQLKHLDIHYSELKEDFFANIGSFIPKLQTLNISIWTEETYSNSFINLFVSMKYIQKIILRNRNENKTIKNAWYFGKGLSEVMLSPNGMNVKHITHNCGLLTTD